jgi:hypothetical protein
MNNPTRVPLWVETLTWMPKIDLKIHMLTRKLKTLAPFVAATFSAAATLQRRPLCGGQERPPL